MIPGHFAARATSAGISANSAVLSVRLPFPYFTYHPQLHVPTSLATFPMMQTSAPAVHIAADIPRESRIFVEPTDQTAFDALERPPGRHQTAPRRCAVDKRRDEPQQKVFRCLPMRAFEELEQLTVLNWIFVE
jgi:hypothetical protein